MQSMETQGIGIKRPHGGKRPGAGRKPNWAKRLATKPLTAAEILAQFDEREAWGRLLTHENVEIQLKARMYLTDRRDGKARQAVDVSGGILHAHTVYRDPRLAGLSQEELQTLDAITKKIPQDPPQPAIESADAPKCPEGLSLASSANDALVQRDR